MVVANLIDEGWGGWKVNVIDEIFLPFEAQQIKAIPLCATSQPNVFHWPMERSGSYSVKSGYKCVCEEARMELASGSNKEAVTCLWLGIWKLKIPGKVKHILWKACTNSLPTKVNLMRKKILTNPQCHLCGKHPEDTLHALWACEVVKRAWCTNFRWVNQFEASYGSFLDLVG